MLANSERPPAASLGFKRDDSKIRLLIKVIIRSAHMLCMCMQRFAAASAGAQASAQPAHATEATRTARGQQQGRTAPPQVREAAAAATVPAHVASHDGTCSKDNSTSSQEKPDPDTGADGSQTGTSTSSCEKEDQQTPAAQAAVASRGPAAESGGSRKHHECAACGVTRGSGVKLRRCAGCASVRYCSEQCQVAHWQSGHKRECRRLRAAAQAAAAAAQAAAAAALQAGDTDAAVQPCHRQ